MVTNEDIDAFYDSLDEAESAIDNIKALWNSMLFSDGEGKRRVMNEIVNQIERGGRGIRTAQALTELVVK